MGHEVVQELMDAFPSLGPHAKLAALDILGRVHALESIPWLQDRLDAPEDDVRARAAHALGAIGATGAAGRLRLALDDPAWPVRAMAAKALSRIRDAEAIPRLRASLTDRAWWVRANAAQALRLAGPPGMDALEEALGDEDPYARHQACVVLESSGVLERRVGQLASSGPSHDAAQRTVLGFVRAGQTSRLQELAAAHGDPVIREKLARLLQPENLR
jgi:HEAT repeat protein